jgi:hypothetical protein
VHPVRHGLHGSSAARFLAEAALSPPSPDGALLRVLDPPQSTPDAHWVVVWFLHGRSFATRRLEDLCHFCGEDALTELPPPSPRAPARWEVDRVSFPRSAAATAASPASTPPPPPRGSREGLRTHLRPEARGRGPSLVRCAGHLRATLEVPAPAALGQAELGRRVRAMSSQACNTRVQRRFQRSSRGRVSTSNVLARSIASDARVISFPSVSQKTPSAIEASTRPEITDVISSRMSE